MKKTFTVNLGGSVFQIDEDAYELVDHYLNNLKLHFGREEGGEEIVMDMEGRISELFAERLVPGKQVITIADVEEIILQMGKLEDLIDEKGKEAASKEGAGTRTVRKKFFRDPDDKMIGGVCSGLAAYTGWDVSTIRLLCILFFGPLMMVYFACWIIVPLARSASDKLAMRGLEENLENIGRTVTEEANKDLSGEKAPQSASERFLSVLIRIPVALFKIVLVVIILCCAPILFAVLAVCFAMLMAGAGVAVAVPSFMMHGFPFLSSDLLMLSPGHTVLVAVTGILVILLPLFALIYAMVRHWGKAPALSTTVKTILLILWFVALGLWIFGVHSHFSFF